MLSSGRLVGHLRFNPSHATDNVGFDYVNSSPFRLSECAEVLESNSTMLANSEAIANADTQLGNAQNYADEVILFNGLFPLV
jgi:hypothetical protein